MWLVTISWRRSLNTRVKTVSGSVGSRNVKLVAHFRELGLSHDAVPAYPMRVTWYVDTQHLRCSYAFIVSTFFLCIRAVSSRNSGYLRQELPWFPRNVLLMLHLSWAQECRAEFGTLMFESYFTTSTVALGAHPSSHSRSRNLVLIKTPIFTYLNRKLIVLGAFA